MRKQITLLILNNWAKKLAKKAMATKNIVDDAIVAQLYILIKMIEAK